MLKFILFPVFKFFERAWKYYRLWVVYKKLGCSDMTLKEFVDELHRVSPSFKNRQDNALRVSILDSTLKEVTDLVPKDKKGLIEEIVQLREENAALREINLELRGE